MGLPVNLTSRYNVDHSSHLGSSSLNHSCRLAWCHSTSLINFDLQNSRYHFRRNQSYLRNNLHSNRQFNRSKRHSSSQALLFCDYEGKPFHVSLTKPNCSLLPQRYRSSLLRRSERSNDERRCHAYSLRKLSV